MDDSKRVTLLRQQLETGTATLDELQETFELADLPDLFAEILLQTRADSDMDNAIAHLLDLLPGLYSERLFTIVVGLLWREDILWLQSRDETGREARLLLLKYVAEKSPASLSPLFWRAVGEKGNDYLLTAFNAIRSTFRKQAAPLLVKLCHATVEERYEIDIRSTVDSFLAAGDAGVRSAFLDAMRTVPQTPRRKIMNHLDISLMAELDKSAIEHRGESFFYDEDSERKKRESKGKDIFAEVARRLERGEKPE